MQSNDYTSGFETYKPAKGTWENINEEFFSPYNPIKARVKKGTSN